MLSILAITAGNASESRHHLDRAKELSRAAASPDSSYWVSFAAGEYYYNVAQSNDAQRNYDDAVAAARRLSDRIRESEALVSRGYNQIRLYKYEEAKSDFDGALAASQAVNDRRGVAISYIALGSISMVGLNRQRAVDYFKKAAEIFSDDVDDSEHGALLSNLGAVYEEFGDIPLSIDYRRRALALFRRTGNVIGIRYTLLYLARIYRLDQDWPSVEVCLDEARQGAEKSGDQQMLGLIDESSGDLWAAQNDLKKAKLYYGSAIRRFISLGFRRQLARVLMARGKILESERSHLAKNDYEHALEIFNEIKDQFSAADALFRLAKIAQRAGDQTLLDSHIRESVRLTSLLRSSVINDGLRVSYASNAYERYSLFLDHLMSMNRASGLSGLTAAESFRNKALFERIDSNNFRIPNVNPVDIETERAVRAKLNAISDEITQRLSTNAPATEIDELSNRLKDANNRLNEIRAEIDKRNPVYAKIRGDSDFDLEGFQREIIDNDSKLIEFWFGSEKSYLWIVSKGEVSTFYLPSREKIEARIENLRKLLAGRQIRDGESVEDYQGRMVALDEEYWREARALSEDLLGQVGDKIKGKRLIIVPDGKLQYFPFGALPEPGVDENRPLIVDHEIVYVPSASVLKLIQQMGEVNKRPEPTKDVLVFADPVFTRDDGRLTKVDAAGGNFISTILGNFRSVESIDKLQRLPATEEEARSIAETVGPGRTTVRTGFAANRASALSDDVTDYKVLHIASHGLIDETRPELSGIVLSMFDEEGKPQDGGFIRMQDVYGLNLNTDLVVLSACDTGLGKVIKGEGVMSLNNAFLQSGAKSVVSSLWKVDDAVTKELMAEFYRGIADDGLTPPAALRQAQVKMLSNPQFSSPFYWAAFTAQGDYRRVPQIAGSRMERFAVPAAVLLAGLLAIYLFLIRRRLMTRSN